jgi:flagellar FliL protein
MAEENEEVKEGEETQSPPEAKKKNTKLIIIIAAVCVVVVVAAFVGFKLLGSEGGKSGKAETAQGHGGGDGEVSLATMFHLEPFILNLTDHGRYLKVTIELEISDESYKMTVQQKVPQLRDTIITLVGSKSIKAISSPEGKFQLKDELLFRANQIMGLEKDIFKNLYFTEFVMQ